MADSAATRLKQLQTEHSVEWVYVTVLRSCKLQERCCTVKGGGSIPQEEAITVDYVKKP